MADYDYERDYTQRWRYRIVLLLLPGLIAWSDVDDSQDSLTCPRKPDHDGKHQYNAKKIQRDK
jgi:hypothetical protein